MWRRWVGRFVAVGSSTSDRRLTRQAAVLGWRMKVITPGIDHIALTVPDLDEQVDRLTSAFGMVVEGRSEFFALVADPASGLKIELSRSDDADVHFRHL